MYKCQIIIFIFLLFKQRTVEFSIFWFSESMAHSFTPLSKAVFRLKLVCLTCQGEKPEFLLKMINRVAELCTTTSGPGPEEVLLQMINRATELFIHILYSLMMKSFENFIFS